MFKDLRSEPVAHLLDNEPAVIGGYTLTEFVFTTVVSITVCPAILSLIGLLLGSIAAGAMLGIAVAALIIWFLSNKLQRVKEGKPNGYYNLKLKLLLNALFNNGFVNRSGQWSMSRAR